MADGYEDMLRQGRELRQMRRQRAHPESPLRQVQPGLLPQGVLPAAGLGQEEAKGMSVIIKGMEMPEDICGEPGYVDVRIFSDGSVIMVKAAPPYYGKFEAIPLQEGHGRLGDLDALEAKLQEEALQHTLIGDLNRMTLGVGEVIDRIRMAKTIVPAEGGGDGK